MRRRLPQWPVHRPWGGVRLEELLGDPPLIAILRGLSPAEAPDIGKSLVEAGFSCLEVPLNSPSPLQSIRVLRDCLGERARVGAGTVLSVYEVSGAADELEDHLSQGEDTGTGGGFEL